MATRKQRRRREKEHRHEYVYLDAEGNEVEPPRGEERPQQKARPKQDAGRKSGGRTVQPPSWRRVIRRGLIFAPIFLAVLLLLGGSKLTFLGAAIQTLFLLVVFVPFSYLMDRFLWRTQQRRLARGG